MAAVDWQDLFISLLLLAVGVAQVTLFAMVAARFGMALDPIVEVSGVLFGPLAFLVGLLVRPLLMLIGGECVMRPAMGRG